MIALALLSMAWAHPVGLSYASVDNGRFTLQISSADVGRISPLSEDLSASRDMLAQLLLDPVKLSRGGAACALGLPAVRGVAPDVRSGDTVQGIELAAPLDCPSAGDWSYHAGFLEKLAPGHRHFVDAGGEPVAVLDVKHMDISFPAAAEPEQAGVPKLAMIGGAAVLLALVGGLFAWLSARRGSRPPPQTP